MKSLIRKNMNPNKRGHKISYKNIGKTLNSLTEDLFDHKYLKKSFRKNHSKRLLKKENV